MVVFPYFHYNNICVKRHNYFHCFIYNEGMAKKPQYSGDTIRAMELLGFKRTTIAEKLGCHINTVCYHLRNVEPTIDENGSTVYTDKQGRPHRVGGPAIIHKDGAQIHYKHGAIHCGYGAAVKRADGTEGYYIDGKQLSKEQFTARAEDKVGL